MSRRMKSSPIIHTSVLVPSTPDEIGMGEAVEERFLTLCKVYIRERGVALVPPTDLNSDMLCWRQMRVRHKKGDFRSSRDEVLATRRVANWTLLVNQKLRNQEQKPVEWAD